MRRDTSYICPLRVQPSQFRPNTDAHNHLGEPFGGGWDKKPVSELLAVLDEADAYVARNGLDFPPEPEARLIGPDPACATDPIRSLDLAQTGITSIVWATGYALDFGWLKVDALDDKGRPRHQRGVCAEPGIYFLGLPWQARRGSAFIWGVWHDASHVADHIAKLRGYLAYAPAPQAQQTA